MMPCASTIIRIHKMPCASTIIRIHMMPCASTIIRIHMMPCAPPAHWLVSMPTQKLHTTPRMCFPFPYPPVHAHRPRHPYPHPHPRSNAHTPSHPYPRPWNNNLAQASTHSYTVHKVAPAAQIPLDARVANARAARRADVCAGTYPGMSVRVSCSASSILRCSSTFQPMDATTTWGWRSRRATGAASCSISAHMHMQFS